MAGTAVPMGWSVLSHHGDGLDFAILLTLGVLIPAALYVWLIRTWAMSMVTGVFLVLVAAGLPVPGYGLYFGSETTGAGGAAWLLFGIPPLCVGSWFVGWIIDLVIQASVSTSRAVIRAVSIPTSPPPEQPALPSAPLVRPSEPPPLHWP